MKRILLVDDEPHVLNALARTLRRQFTPQQLDVHLCTGPTQALQRLLDAHFDVVISDFSMPQMDGITFLHRARELDPRAVRMMLSAAADFDTLLAAVNHAAVFRYIPKPWDESQLLSALRDALAFDPYTPPCSIQIERRRLEALEPGITHVDWGPGGEVYLDMPSHPSDL